MSPRVAASDGNGKVLVLGGGTGAFLGVIRSLGRAGLEVHVGWESRGAPALRSRYVHRIHTVAPHARPDGAWLSQLAGVMRRERFDLVIPTDEVGIRALQQHGGELERWGRLCLPPDQAVRVLSDEAETARLARALGLRVPESRLVRERMQGAGLDAELGLPLELKPWRSDDPTDPGPERTAHVAAERADYQRLLESMLQDGPVVVQEHVAGQRVGVGLLLGGGEPLLTFQHVHVHEPQHEGGSAYLKSVPLTPELVGAASKLLRAVGFDGVALVGFRLEPATGTWALSGVHAGFWDALPVSLAAGVDFPVGLYRLLTGGPTFTPGGYRSGVHCRHLLGDMVWLLARLRVSRSDPRLALRLVRDVSAEFLRNALARREHTDAFAVDDPLPFAAELVRTLRMGMRLVQRRAKRPLASATPMRRRLSHRAERAVRGADSVLFVCAGNICRSPFAEGRARALKIFPVIASAGHDAVENGRSPHLAIKAALHWDVQLAPHRAHQVDEADVRSADAIFVFDEDNEQRLIDRFPSARERIHYMGALRADGRLFVDDPFGGDLETFAASYANIEAALEEMARIRGIHRGGR